MNLAELKLAVTDYTDDPNHDQFDEPQLARFINTALRQVARKLELADENRFIRCATFSVISPGGIDQAFDLPADFKRIKVLERLNGSDEPTPVEWVSFTDRHQSYNWPPHHLNDLRGPRAALKGNQFVIISPTEDMDLVLWYYYSVHQLDSDDDEPLDIPRDNHDTIALLAAKIAISGIEGKTFGLQKELDEGMADLLKTAINRNRQTSRQVRWMG